MAKPRNGPGVSQKWHAGTAVPTCSINRSLPAAFAQQLNKDFRRFFSRLLVPWVVDGLFAAEAAHVIRNDLAVLADDGPVGVGVDINRPSDRLGHHRVFVLVEPNQTGLRDRGRADMKAIELVDIRHQARSFRLEYIPAVLSRRSG